MLIQKQNKLSSLLYNFDVTLEKSFASSLILNSKLDAKGGKPAIKIKILS